MKKITILVALSTLIFLAGCANYTVPKQSETDKSNNTGLKICPNEWIDNQMPGDESGGEDRQYYILDGERIEINEFDSIWVQNNCNLEKQVVW